MKILDFLNNKLEMCLCVALMSALALVLGFQVFMRYCMQASLSWSEECARYLFVWLVFIGISYGARMIRHIKIDAGLLCFPKVMRPYVVIFGDVLSLIFSLWVVYFGWSMVKMQLTIGQLSPAMRIPMWLVYSAPMVGFSLTSIRLVQSIFYHIKHRNDKEDPDAETFGN